MQPGRALAAIAAAASVAACAHHEEPGGPGGLAYACADGRPARIFYEGGGDPARGRARLLFDGRSFDMTAAPAMTGLRYISEAGLTGGHRLIWSAEGEDSALVEAPADPAASGEREIVRCTRSREEGAETQAEDQPHGSDPH